MKLNIKLCLLSMVALPWVYASDLQVTNLRLTEGAGGGSQLIFDLSWDDSWRRASADDPLYFHDAIWIVFKLREGKAEAPWQHLSLAKAGTNPEGTIVGSGTPIEVIVPDDRVGLFVRRATEGKGAVAVKNVSVACEMPTSARPRGTPRELCALGVEMVYVARGPFYLGCGSAADGALCAGGAEDAPFLVQNEAQITIANAAGGLWGNSSLKRNGIGEAGLLPAHFPNGFASFYCMKYELTQGEFVTFINTLTRRQQAAHCKTTTLHYYRCDTAGGSPEIRNRNTVQLVANPDEPAPRVYATARPARACNWICWRDLAAFSDWAGLRPMTELEYEKACRGPQQPLPGEYAWGTTNIMPPEPLVLSGVEDGHERLLNDVTTGACQYGKRSIEGGDGGLGPLRAGIFAAPGASRSVSGASFWGIMELSGNVWERVITLGNAEGRAFSGTHGDGHLTSDGDADVADWPAPLTGQGAGFRGGNWFDDSERARVADRYWGSQPSNDRKIMHGGRAVRSAPK